MKNILKSNSLYFVIILSILTFTACSESDPVTPQEQHYEATGITLESNGNILVRVFEGKVDSTVAPELKLPMGETGPIQVNFLDNDGNIEVPPDDPQKSLGWIITDPDILDLNKSDSSDWEFTLTGKKAGATELEIQILHNGHTDFRTPKIPVVIK